MQKKQSFFAETAVATSSRSERVRVEPGNGLTKSSSTIPLTR